MTIMYADLIANVMVFIFLMEMNGNQDIRGQIHETLHRFIATTRYMQKKKRNMQKCSFVRFTKLSWRKPQMDVHHLFADQTSRCSLDLSQQNGREGEQLLIKSRWRTPVIIHNCYA